MEPGLLERGMGRVAAEHDIDNPKDEPVPDGGHGLGAAVYVLPRQAGCGNSIKSWHRAYT
jgi:hypothetical protein